MSTDFVDSPKQNTANALHNDTNTDSSGAGNSVTTSQSRVACSGSGGALGHPQIWLNLGNDGAVTCPYCSRHFVLEKS